LYKLLVLSCFSVHLVPVLVVVGQGVVNLLQLELGVGVDYLVMCVIKVLVFDGYVNDPDLFSINLLCSPPHGGCWMFSILSKLKRLAIFGKLGNSFFQGYVW